MKKLFLILGVSAVGALIFLLVDSKQKTNTSISEKRISTAPFSEKRPSDQPTTAINNVKEFRKNDIDQEWLQSLSAGIAFEQKPDPETNWPIGFASFNESKIFLGEVPPWYRYQLQTHSYKLMLGDQHQRRSFEICATSICIKPDGIAREYPLWVTYPRWSSQAGLETSGGFVFMKNENPIQKIGVLVPKVIPIIKGAEVMLDWQIQIGAEISQKNVDLVSKAKPEPLGPDKVVLMATHPDKIPTISNVVWFKFEKDGKISLIDNSYSQ